MKIIERNCQKDFDARHPKSVTRFQKSTYLYKKVFIIKSALSEVKTNPKLAKASRYWFLQSNQPEAFQLRLNKKNCQNENKIGSRRFKNNALTFDLVTTSICLNPLN